MSEPLKTVRRGRVLEVTLNRPKANAIDAATSIRMGEIFCDFRDDDSLWVAILTGAGDRIFSAGWDLKAATEGEAVRSAWSEQAAMSEALIVGIEPTATPGRVHRCRTSPRRATRFRLWKRHDPRERQARVGRRERSNRRWERRPPTPHNWRGLSQRHLLFTLCNVHLTLYSYVETCFDASGRLLPAICHEVLIDNCLLPVIWSRPRERSRNHQGQ